MLFDQLISRFQDKGDPSVLVDEEDAFADEEEEDLHPGLDGDNLTDKEQWKLLWSEIKNSKGDALFKYKEIIQNEQVQESLYNFAVTILNFLYDGVILMRLMRKLNRRHPSIPALSYAESVAASRVIAGICRSAIDNMNRIPSTNFADFKAKLKGK